MALQTGYSALGVTNNPHLELGGSLSASATARHIVLPIFAAASAVPASRSAGR